MRIGEHRRAVEKKDMKNANAVHSEILNHRINWEESTVVEREKKNEAEENQGKYSYQEEQELQPG